MTHWVATTLLHWPSHVLKKSAAHVVLAAMAAQATVLLASAAVLTAIYTTRLVLLTFFGEPRNHHAYDHAHESPFIMAAPLVILAVLATVAALVNGASPRAAWSRPVCWLKSRPCWVISRAAAIC
mgnify:CR=1 FL=1